MFCPQQGLLSRLYWLHKMSLGVFSLLLFLGRAYIKLKWSVPACKIIFLRFFFILLSRHVYGYRTILVFISFWVNYDILPCSRNLSFPFKSQNFIIIRLSFIVFLTYFGSVIKYFFLMFFHFFPDIYLDISKNFSLKSVSLRLWLFFKELFSCVICCIFFF